MPPVDAEHQRGAEEPFILTAMVSLVTGTAWLAFQPELVLRFYYDPALLALTHLFTLGFVTSVVMGVSLRAVPMAVGVLPLRRWLAVVQFVLFFIGFTGMVAHFRPGQEVALAWATLLPFAAALLQAVNFARLWPKARAGDWVARHVVAAQLHLILAAALGVTYGMQSAGYVWTRDLYNGSILDRLSAHLHLAAVGWVTTMIFGFQLKLLPTTAGSPRHRWPRFLLLQLGLIGLVVCLLWSLPGTTLFALMLVAAVLWQAWQPLRAIHRRTGFLWEAVALVLLVAIALTGLLLLLGWPQPLSQARFRVQFAYGYSALYGWVLVTVGAVAFKLFPLWVWKERFEPDWGKKPVPAVYELASKTLKNLSGGLITGGVLGAAAGIASGHALTVAIALKVVLAGVVAFVVNFARTARWALLPIEYRPSGPEAGRPDD